MSTPQDRPPQRPGRAHVPAPRSGTGGVPVAPARPGRAVRIAAYPLLAVLGVLVGLAGCFVQGLWFPGGLLLSLGGAAALFCGGRLFTGTRVGAALPAVGWFAVLLVANTQRPEGDFLLAANLGSYVFLLGGMALAVLCAAMPSPLPFQLGRDTVPGDAVRR
ncbi:DUF6113 family protein [Streptacidiphilus sp. EB129]|uniref:DUF6113 family protein n=1 Tax=Streptacidiphilus sp. EB129 TaxID=3156262 RepID=UPI0035196240